MKKNFGPITAGIGTTSMFLIPNLTVDQQLEMQNPRNNKMRNDINLITFSCPFI